MKTHQLHEFLVPLRIQDVPGNARYALFGTGLEARKIIQALSDHGLPPPALIIDDRPREDGLPCQPLEALGDTDVEMVILASELHEMAMFGRLCDRFPQRHIRTIDIIGLVPSSAQYLNRDRSPTGLRRLLYIARMPILIDLYLKNLFSYLDGKVFNVVHVHPGESFSHLLDEQCAGALVWNGGWSNFRSALQQLQDAGVRPHFVECGMFPQADFFYIDRRGVNAKRELAVDNLDWVGAREMDGLMQLRHRYFGGAAPSKTPAYGLVPLQVPTDTNIHMYTRFKNGMQEFIDFIEDTYPNDTLLIKPHPLDALASTYKTRRAHISHAPFHQLLGEAKWVHGITSTTLYEAALFGLEVRTEGKSLLSIHYHQRDKLLAAIVASQIHKQEVDPSPWLTQFTDWGRYLPN